MIYNLRALQVFESVSRNGSISAAALELSISPSAISHQLRKLGDQVGERLVERSGRNATLTSHGKKLAESLTLAFNQIDESVANCIGREGVTLRLAMCSTFGTGWLINRLGRFREKNPTVSVQLMMYGDDPIRVEAAADAFITIMPPRDGFWCLNLFDEHVVAVTAANFDRSQRLDDATFITTSFDRDDFAPDWRSYLSRADMDLKIELAQTIQCSHEVFALEAVKRGLGIALIPTFMAEADLEAGTIVKWRDLAVPSGRTYNFCVKSSKRHSKNIESLSKWMYREKLDYAKHSKIN
ncbi:hypothetical protein ASC97_10440 [Rhizobium sp. Root1203]|uniref:LysR family transcriptional regulator n=1 Tax=Rhizobium sp. Root1203 TaxID=1736427 RepID=UPI000709B0A4|nr:LysR family transcriptional regulator [Rhizobium sp. Root1203]KQV20418.1 hypothetical protein ASC97_10440 [Rhizobium sp. Root1203]